MSKHKLLWLAGRVALAMFYEEVSEDKGNDEAARFFAGKCDSLEEGRPDALKYAEANEEFWGLVETTYLALGGTRYYQH